MGGGDNHGWYAQKIQKITDNRILGPGCNGNMITSKILKLYENVWLVEYITPGRLLRTCCPSPPGAGMNTRAFLTSEKKHWKYWKTIKLLECAISPPSLFTTALSFCFGWSAMYLMSRINPGQRKVKRARSAMYLKNNLVCSYCSYKTWGGGGRLNDNVVCLESNPSCPSDTDNWY